MFSCSAALRSHSKPAGKSSGMPPVSEASITSIKVLGLSVALIGKGLKEIQGCLVVFLH